MPELFKFHFMDEQFRNYNNAVLNDFRFGHTKAVLYSNSFR